MNQIEEKPRDLKDLITALCKAQAEYPDIPKTREGQEGNRKFKYADLSDIHKAIKPVNLKHGLAISHSSIDGILVSTLYHTSGQSISTAIPIPKSERLKEVGSSLTYIRRYSIQNLLDISTDQDLDSTDTKGNDNKGKNQNVNTKAPALTNKTMGSPPVVKSDDKAGAPLFDKPGDVITHLGGTASGLTVKAVWNAFPVQTGKKAKEFLDRLKMNDHLQSWEQALLDYGHEIGMIHD